MQSKTAYARYDDLHMEPMPLILASLNNLFARYWAPTSCQANSPDGGGFCSQYTQAGYPAATHLSLHGEHLVQGGKSELCRI